MRTQVFLISLLMTGVVYSAASGQNWAAKMFNETAHDFGNVTKGEIPEFRFEIENIYQEDVVIDRVYTSCQCVTLSLTRNTLKTFEKGEIVCKFNSPAFDGKRQATVTVRFVRPFVAEVQLNVKGNIVRGVNFAPDSIEFGQITEQSLLPRTVRISSAGNPNFRIVDVISTFPHIAVQLRETVRSLNLVTYEMTARLKPDVPSGFNQGELYLVVEENSVRRQIPIKFSARVVSALQLPESVTLGPLAPGKEGRQRVIIKSEQEFQVTDVTCANPAFKVKADAESRKVHFVELVFSGTEEVGFHESELTFFINNLPTPAGKLKASVEVAR
jgi:hypothetical protein